MNSESVVTKNLTPEEKRVLLAKLLKEKAERTNKEYPLSFNQWSMWFLYKMSPASIAYNVAFSARIFSPLDKISLQRAFQALVDRHAVLRTTYTTKNNQPIQIIHEHQEISFEEIDASEWSEEILAEQVNLQHRRPFDLEQGPVLRVSVFSKTTDNHVLLISAHHIAVDGWSSWLLLDELRTLYSGFTKGQTITLPPIETNYIDYVEWQSEMLEGPEGEKHLEYWKAQLGGDLPIMDFPTDYPRPATQSFQGRTISFSLDEDLSQKLKLFAKAEGTTLYIVLLTALNALLYRYTGQTEIMVGSQIAGRNQARWAKILGCFVNTVILKMNLNEAVSFRQFVKEVRHTVVNALAHQEYPLQLLTKHLQLHREPSQSPLIPVDFVLQKPQQYDELTSLFFSTAEKACRLDFAGLQMEYYPLTQQEGQLDITLEMMEGATYLLGSFKYDTDLFKEATIIRIISHFKTLLSSIVADPDQPVALLPMLTSAEEQQLLFEWNDTGAYDQKETQCIHQLFEAQAAANPDAIAVVVPASEQNPLNQTLTYQELNQHANQLAHYLIKLGIGRESIVGLCISRSREMIIGLLAVLKAGGAYLPLDPDYPRERLAFMIQDTQASVILTQSSVGMNIPEHGGTTLYLDADWQKIAKESTANPVCHGSPDSLAYIIYTSGSTGNPKGTLIEHRSVVNFVESASQEFGVRAEDRVLQFASISFDTSGEEIYPCLLRGASLVLRTNDMVGTAATFLQKCREWRLTILDLPTAYWHELTMSIAQEVLSVPENVRLVIIGGEKAIPEHIKTWQRCVGKQVRLVNTYGQTEGTMVSTMQDLSEPKPTEISVEALVGRPIRNVQAYILDKNLQPVPIGIPGELHIGGAGLARGYLNLPELTAKKFIPHPFSADPRARLYKTGDLVRYREDGNIEFLGRVDHQVKIRGFRIELEEIETVLRQHPAVRESVVVARGDEKGRKNLVAYYTLYPDAETSVNALQQFLKQNLPDYMVPDYFVRLEMLPLNSSGKINRKALPEPDADAAVIHNTYVEPKTPLQELVAGVWANILGLKQVGVEDNFFELGGHSLLATQVISRLQRLIGADLPLRILFEFPTVASLTSQMESLQGKKSSDASPIKRYERQGSLPLSYSQERLWFLDQMEPGNSTYNMSAAIRLKGSLNLPCFEKSLNEILTRHEVLRTNFHLIDDQPVQIIGPAQSFPLAVFDLSGLTGEEQITEAKRLVEKEGKRAFDLRKDLLIRASLLKLNKDEHIFLLTMHHIVSDGWSITVFAREFISLYSALVKGQPNPLPPLSIQYADFAQWQREWLQGERLQAQLAYWKQQLDGELPQLELLLDKPRPAIQSHQSGRVQLELSTSLFQMLRHLSQQEEATLFMTLLAAFKLLLHKHTGLEDIVVGSPIAGRNRAETENLIGFFLNTLVLRTDLSGNPSFRELIHRLKKVAMDAYTYQDIPFEMLLMELQPERNPSRTPLFQVFFNMLNFELGDGQQLPELTAESFDPPALGANFDLTVYVAKKDHSLSINLVYNSDIFTAEHIHSLLVQYEHLLIQIVADPNKRLNNYSLVTPDTEKVLPNPHLPLNSTWHGPVQAKFAENAKNEPNHIALVDRHASWSYEELNHLSNQLANYLRINGVQPQEIVAVYGHRSAAIILALLGILKAGAAFVIFDPSYPAQRLVDYLRLTKPRAWLQLDNVKAVPALLQNFVANLSDCCQLTLPAIATQVATLLQEYAMEPPAVVVDPDDLAYVAFTSGSTGQPKGILGSHKPLSHFIDWHIQTFDLKQADHFSLLSGLAHDPLLRDIFTPLCLGATLFIPDQEQILSPGELLSWMKAQRVSITHLTPSLQQLLVTTSSNSQNDLPNLRLAFFGGEPLTRQHIVSLSKLAPNATCVNFYGATETPQAMSYSIVDSTQCREIIPLGRGIQDVQLLVLNSAKQLSGLGEIGEIYIRTPYLSQGYLHDDKLTQQRFLVNRFANDATDLIYKTGDRGRYLPNGEVEFLGRNDNQVKIRGFRIELGEIETILNSHPGVKQSIVSQAANKHLVAYIVPDALQFPKVYELRGYLQQSLPSYMIPAHFVLIDTIPLTPNGKVDRRALPDPDVQNIQETTFVAPQTQLQELLAGIWTDILNLEVVGIHDNFFQLGGHSLLATQIMSRVRRVIPMDLPLRVLFECPTIASMAAKIESLQQEIILEIPPLKPYIHDKPPRLSFTQERMWFIHQLAPESAAYNMSSSVRLYGELDIEILEQAFNIIIERHAILRTTFDTIDGEPVQRIAPAGQITVPVIDLQSFDGAEQDHQVQKLITTKAREPFDLANGPLLRVLIIKLGEHDHILFTSMHHIVSDQWSGGVMTHEFTVIYNAISTNTPIPLSDLPVQYADYSLWQRDWLKGDVLAAKLAFWKKQLEGISVLNLPTDYPRPAVQTYNGSFERLPIPPSTIDAIRNLCRQEQVTPFMFFLGIFKVLLLRYTGQQDVVVGSPIANRNWFETERLIGVFVNTVVLRTRLIDNPTFKEFLRDIRNMSLDAFNHQDFPFEKLIEELQPKRDMSYSPLVQVLFNVQNAPVTMPQLHKNPSIAPVWTPTRAAQFDLTLSVSTDIFPHMVLTYNTDLFKRDTILRMLGHLEMLVNSALTNLDQRVLDLPMLTQSERKKQLVVWNDTLLEYPQSACVHQLVEAQAERTPDAIAVQFKDQEITYHELNSRANQLAYYLQKLGVSPETLIGISMERSAEMVIGLLGILKAGGTYIPLDPLFPRDRLEYMLENSQTRILLTHERLRSGETSEALKKSGLLEVSLDGDWPLIFQYAVENPSVSTQPHNLAYVLFTSGSTGKPKGVQIPHRAVVNFLTSMQQKPGLTSNDQWLSVTTLSFDISVLEVFLPLITGASVVVAPREAVYDGAALIQYLSTRNVTVMQATPATWQMLIDAGWQGDKNLKVLCGGEAMSKDLARWLTQHVNCVWNMYGPTETTVWSTICEISSDTEVITIGRPIANTQIYILDKNLEPVPVGVVGELYIAGDGVGRGYLNQPELTAEKFVADPFCGRMGALMYRTGDQARFLADGQIEFLGRVDFQVKVRGYRIELGEIETVLNQHPNIRQAVVIVREDTPRDKRLVAYLIPEHNSKPDTGDLRQYLKTKLPEYMVPSAFVVLQEFPMTPNRKVNRKALPAPDLTTKRDFVPPRTVIEGKLAKIWESILGIVKIDVHDNFFELGGHSLLAVRMFARIKEEFGINLPLATLFQEATIEHLANIITSQTISSIWPSLVEIEPEGNHPPFFCIHGITGDILWFRDLAKCLAPDYPFYGLQARGLDGVQNPIPQIEEMAARYIEEIRVLQPRGPYLLGGASFGGTVALEIAQQLLTQGEQIALLAIFDHSPPNVQMDIDNQSFKNRLVMGGKMIKNFPYWLQEFLHLGPSRMLMRIRRKLRFAQKTRGQIGVDNLGQIDATDVIDFAPTLPSYRQHLITNHYKALGMYVPQPYPGHVTLFRARSRPLLSTFDPAVAWQKLAAGQVCVIDIMSSHEGMFKKPHVYSLAEALKNCIDNISNQADHQQPDGIRSQLFANLLYFLFSLALVPLIA